jgi:hypothetical protein
MDKELDKQRAGLEQSSESTEASKEAPKAAAGCMPCPSFLVTFLVVFGMTLLYMGITRMIDTNSQLEYALRNWLVLVDMCVKHVRARYLVKYYTDSGTSTLLTEVKSGLASRRWALPLLQSNLAYVSVLELGDCKLARERLRHLANLSSAVRSDSREIQLWHRSFISVSLESSSPDPLNQTAIMSTEAATIKEILSVAAKEIEQAEQFVRPIMSTVTDLYSQVRRCSKCNN